MKGLKRLKWVEIPFLNPVRGVERVEKPNEVASTLNRTSTRRRPLSVDPESAAARKLLVAPGRPRPSAICHSGRLSQTSRGDRAVRNPLDGSRECRCFSLRLAEPRITNPLVTEPPRHGCGGRRQHELSRRSPDGPR